MIRIAELEFDDSNVSKLWEHGITPQEITQILQNAFTVRRNKKNRAGSRQLIGFTDAGRLLTVILAPTHDPERWRPVTGWQSTDFERRALT
jgi:uncharacterized DUF497 family protein